MDVRDSAMVRSIVQETVREFGQIDILVNAAGVPGRERPALKMTDEDIDHVMEINFRETFLTSREVAREMVKCKSGKIINIASIMTRIGTRNLAGYCASKAAVVQLTRVMALELMRYNIQANALGPGYFLTDFNRDFFQTEMGRNFIKKMIPIAGGEHRDSRQRPFIRACASPIISRADPVPDFFHLPGWIEVLR